MFAKKVVILTTAIGVFHKSAHQDVKKKMEWMGVSYIKTCGISLLEDVIWDNISNYRKTNLIKKLII